MGEGGRGERAKNSPEVKIRIKSIIVYQEQCSISRFVVHLYKIMISPHLHAFFSFSKFWFFGLVGGGGRGEGKRAKMVQDDKKIVCCTPYFRNHTLYDCHLWYTFVVK